MSGEKILLVSDSLEGPTGFGVNGCNIAWCLADKYDVHVLGLQSVQDQQAILNFQGDKRTVIQHANLPRSNEKYDFGQKSLPRLLQELKPDILLTINDIQMVNHIPSILYPSEFRINALDMPSRVMRSREELHMELDALVDRLKEKYPPTTKWIAYCPQDGHPPIPNWRNVYYAADQVVAMSKYGQWVFKKWFLMDVPYIHHGVDTENFKPFAGYEELSDKFVVGDVNRNQPRKQPIRLIEAFAKFAKDKNDVVLWLHKDWNDVFGWPLQYFVQLYDIQDKTINPRPVGIPREEMAKIYNSFSVNMMGTSGEGFGLPTIEAAACGVPTIATDYTTSKELIIDGKPSPRGILVPYKTLFWDKLNVAAVQRALVDTDELAKSLQYYYDNRDELRKHGKNALEWVKRNVSLDIIERKWNNIVKKVLEASQ